MSKDYFWNDTSLLVEPTVAGGAVDDSGNGYAITLAGTSSVTASEFKYTDASIDMDIASYVRADDVCDELAGLTDFTIDMWYKGKTGIASGQTILAIKSSDGATNRLQVRIDQLISNFGDGPITHPTYKDELNQSELIVNTSNWDYLSINYRNNKINIAISLSTGTINRTYTVGSNTITASDIFVFGTDVTSGPAFSGGIPIYLGALRVTNKVRYYSTGYTDPTALFPREPLILSRGAYKFYRMDITANNGHASKVGVTEIKLLDSNDNLIPLQGEGTASTTGASGSPNGAFDTKYILGTGGSYWLAGAATGWVQYENPIPAILYSYEVAARSTQDITDPTQAPKDWTIQGSMDGSSWTVLHTVTGVTGWVSNVFKVNNYNGPLWIKQHNKEFQTKMPLKVNGNAHINRIGI